MCNPPLNYRTSFLSLRSVFRLASLFCRPLVVLSLAVVTLGLLGPAAIAQNIFNCSSFTTTSGAVQYCVLGMRRTIAFSARQAGSVSGGVIRLCSYRHYPQRKRDVVSNSGKRAGVYLHVYLCPKWL